MKPKLIVQHAFAGSVATIRSGSKTAKFLIDGADESGATLFGFLMRDGWRVSDARLKVPASRVIEITHGVRSSAPNWLKKEYFRGVR